MVGLLYMGGVQAMDVTTAMLFTRLRQDSLLEEINQNLDAGIIDVNACDLTGRSLLMVAALKGHADVCELLIKRGANVNSDRDGIQTALTLAAYLGRKNTARTLLTTIPRDVSDLISKDVPAYLMGLFYLRHISTVLPKDIRKLIAQKLIDSLVLDQMPRIERLIAFRDILTNLTSRDLALRQTEPECLEVAQLLDLSNANSRKELTTRLDANIKRIIFGEPAMIIIRRKNQ